MPPRSADPRILGQLLVMQSCIPLMDSDEQLFDMLRRAMEGVPGVAASEIHLGEGVAGPWAGPRLAIETGREQFGWVTVTVDDAEAFAIYEPLLRNLMGVVALWLENRLRQKRLQRTLADLEAAMREREAMLAVVSHDLASPLGAIVNAAQLMRDDPGEAARVLSSANLIERSARRMGRLIHDLLDLATMDAGHFSLVPAPCDLHRLVREAVEECRGIACDKEIAVKVRLDEEVPPVPCDGQRVAQVLVNLLGNACKFTPRGGTVTVSTARRLEDVLVSVGDTGSGIQREDLPHVFERFYRSKGVSQAGSGLGLAIAKAIIDRHGGSITVESHPGEGALFSFTLPLRPGPVAKDRLLK